MITGKRVTALLAALLVCVGFILPMPAQAATLTYWYSESNQIGKWSYSPSVYYLKVTNTDSFPLATGVFSATSQWNSALGTSITYSSTNTSAPIKYYGGTIEDLDDKGYILDIEPDNTLGITDLTKRSSGQHFYYEGNVRKICAWYTITSAVGNVIYRPEDPRFYSSIYIKTTIHEVGHAMGWLDHPPEDDDYSTWAMYPGIYANTTLKTGEKNHLAQMYP